MICIKTFSELGGKTRKVLQFPIEGSKTWSGFNPSIGISPDGKIAMTIRSSNYVIVKPHDDSYLLTGGKVRNRLWFAELNNSLEIESLEEITVDQSKGELRRGVEDARLFWRDGWEIIAVMLEQHTPRARLARYKLVEKTAWLQEKLDYSFIDSKRMEKNWMPTMYPNAKFDYVHDSLNVVTGGTLVRVSEPKDLATGVRGGSCLWNLDDGTYLAVVHKTYVKTYDLWDSKTFSKRERIIKTYAHMFARYDENGAIIALSDEFSFVEPGIEFAAGLIVKGDDVVVSFGFRDAASCVGVISFDKVMGMLKELK